GFAGGDRQRVGLLAGGGRAAPHQQRLAAPVHRAQLAGQQREVVGLAEERGQVGGQRVDELFVLAVGVAFHQVEVVGEALDPARAQAPRQDRKSTRLNSSHVKISYA